MPHVIFGILSFICMSFAKSGNPLKLQMPQGAGGWPARQDWERHGKSCPSGSLLRGPPRVSQGELGSSLPQRGARAVAGLGASTPPAGQRSTATGCKGTAVQGRLHHHRLRLSQGSRTSTPCHRGPVRAAPAGTPPRNRCAGRHAGDLGARCAIRLAPGGKARSCEYSGLANPWSQPWGTI